MSHGSDSTHDMEHHPIANVFPLLLDPELQALADDIRKNGLREPL